MNPRSVRWIVWSVAGLLIAGSTLAIASPMLRAFLCVARYSQAAQATAELLAVTEEAAVVRIESGPRSGETCSVLGRFEPEAPGRRLEVVYLDDHPERCELSSTLSNSQWMLATVAIALASLFLLVIAGAIALVRTLTRPADAARRLEPSSGTGTGNGNGTVLCPGCGAKMAEGYVALQAGLHWREPGQPIGLTPLFSGLPGTVGLGRRPRLHAFRCERCEVLTVQYGSPDR